MNTEKPEPIDVHTWLPHILGSHALLFIGLAGGYLIVLPFFANSFLSDRVLDPTALQHIVIFTAAMQRHWFICVLLILCLLGADVAVFIRISKTYSLKAGLYWATVVQTLIGFLLLFALVLAINSLYRTEVLIP
jgi:hypothetical protein